MNFLAGFCGQDDEPGGGQAPKQPNPLPPVAAPPAPVDRVRRGGKLRAGFFGPIHDLTPEGVSAQPAVNVVFVTTWGWPIWQDWLILQLTEAKAAGITDAIISPPMALYVGGPPVAYIGTAACQTALRDLCDRMRAAGVLEMFWAFYDIDEGGRDAKVPEADVLQCHVDARAVFAEYPELARGVALITVAGDDERIPGRASYNGMGIDAYSQGVDVLTGPIARLTATLRPDQFVILVPCGADPHRQSLAPFIDYAAEHLEVGLVMPFIWVDYNDQQVFAGIARNSMAGEYLAAMQAIRSPAPSG